VASRSKTQTPGWISSAPQNDVDLLSRIKRRDPAAMGDLYDRYGKTAYAVILRTVLKESVAEDLLAETLVTVWNQIARWKDARIEDLRLWVLLLARNHAVEHLRSQNEPLPRALPRLNALTQPAILQDFPRPRNNEEWLRLRNAVASLSAAEASILEMACFDGVPLNEIAVSLGITVAALKEAIDGALHKLAG
jgi:RNA polymerase sigma-70 factor (ECF subfamily)